MEIILSQRCKSFTGTISRYHGFAIRRTGNRFFSYRFPSTSVPPDGHWKFIVECAELAKQGLMFTDIKVTAGELDDALEEATDGRLQTPWAPRDAVVNASQVLTLKSELGL